MIPPMADKTNKKNPYAVRLGKLRQKKSPLTTEYAREMAKKKWEKERNKAQKSEGSDL